MTDIKRMFIGTVIFGLGTVTGYFISKKMLDDQYRTDVAEVQRFYKQKLDELGVMEADFELPDSNKEECSEELYGNNKEDEDEDADIIATYRGEKRRVIIDYTKPSLEQVKFNFKEGNSIIVDVNGDENLGNIDDDEYDEDNEVSNDEEYDAEIERMADDYARRRSENMQKGEPYLIEPEEYREGPEDYDRQALYYYAEDRTLCEDNDREVSNEK